MSEERHDVESYEDYYYEEQRTDHERQIAIGTIEEADLKSFRYEALHAMAKIVNEEESRLAKKGKILT